jgi:hypothetical protein
MTTVKALARSSPMRMHNAGRPVRRAPAAAFSTRRARRPRARRGRRPLAVQSPELAPGVVLQARGHPAYFASVDDRGTCYGLRNMKGGAGLCRVAVSPAGARAGPPRIAGKRGHPWPLPGPPRVGAPPGVPSVLASLSTPLRVRRVALRSVRRHFRRDQGLARCHRRDARCRAARDRGSAIRRRAGQNGRGFNWARLRRHNPCHARRGMFRPAGAPAVSPGPPSARSA